VPPLTDSPGPAPFGAAELSASVAGASRVLDVGCGSGRLTVALALAGAGVTGIDTSAARLEDARERALAAGVELALVEADMNEPLPFADGAFDAVTSRLSLMIADDPVATLRELARVLAPGGHVATAVWASLPENPWFAAPREAVAAVLGPERAGGRSAASAPPRRPPPSTGRPVSSRSRPACCASWPSGPTLPSTGACWRARTATFAGSTRRWTSPSAPRSSPRSLPASPAAAAGTRSRSRAPSCS